MDWITALCLGITLSAAAGFRVFVPLLVLSAAAQMDGSPVALKASWAWIGSPWATAAFGVATLLEVGTYYVPWIDNAVDALATPAAILAGAFVSVAATSDYHPALQWAAGLTGAGAAGTVQIGTVAVRALSSATTGGLGNPVVATAEAAGSLGLAVLAVAIPLLAAAAAMALLAWAASRLLRARRTEDRAPATA